VRLKAVRPDTRRHESLAILSPETRVRIPVAVCLENPLQTAGFLVLRPQLHGDRPRVQVREQFYRGERKRLKSGNGRRSIPLSAGMAARLIAHRRDNYGGEEGPVFASSVGTELIPANLASAFLRPAARSVSLNGITFHTFRHACASLLFEAGRNVKQVQEWLGHADAGFTLRTYVHLMDEGIGNAEFMDEAMIESAGREPGAPVCRANR
jgi:Phage integrase family